MHATMNLVPGCRGMPDNSKILAGIVGSTVSLL